MWAWIVSAALVIAVAIAASYVFCRFYVPVRVRKATSLAGNEPAKENQHAR